MLKKFRGNNGTKKENGSIQQLRDEREILLQAMEIVTQERRPQLVNINGQKYVVRDFRRGGREIEPV